MGAAKEFFNKRIFINCLAFSIPVSMLLMWRFTQLQDIPFFSTDAGIAYSVFVVASFLFFLFIFFILYCLSKRPQKD